jgi:hypothetical protein
VAAGTSGAAQSAEHSRRQQVVEDLKKLEGGADLMNFWYAVKYGSQKLPVEVAKQTGSFFPLGRDANGQQFDQDTMQKFTSAVDKITQRQGTAKFIPDLLCRETLQTQVGNWVKEWANAPLLAGVQLLVCADPALVH